MSLSGKDKKQINSSMKQVKDVFKSADKEEKQEIINRMKIAEAIMEGYEKSKSPDKDEKKKVKEGREIFMKTRKELENEFK